MLQHRYQQKSLWEVVLPDADKLWPEDLRRVDEVLEDETVVEIVAEALAMRWPKSRTRGRRGTPAEVVLRMLVLKHLYRWSYEELEREVRSNLVFREFARVGLEKVPGAKTILKIAQVLGEEVIEKLHQRVVELAVEAGVSKGRRLRIDTTVVETNVHYPTDSSLMADGVGVITRVVKRVEKLIGKGRKRFRDCLRSVKRRSLEIKMQARSEAKKAERVRSYRKLIRVTKKVVRQAERVGRRVASRLRQAVDPEPVRRELKKAQECLNSMTESLERVVEQAKRRVVGGDTHVPDKVLSLFEPHTEAIRKGKMDKPTEFGKMVSIQEAENGLVTDYTVEPKRVSDSELWEPALEKHEEIFGRPPTLAAADRGFASQENEQVARNHGIRRVCLPKRGRRTAKRRAHERQRWFRRGQKWRAGSEACISTLKRRHGLNRCLYRGVDGMERWVGLGIVANNLLAIGRRSKRRSGTG